MPRTLLLLAMGVFLGCATFEKSPEYASRINEIDVPLLEIQHRVSGFVPVGVRNVSPNGREFFSKYFIIGNDEYLAAGEALDRFFVQVTILGDRRPYDIEVIATHEQRVLRGEAFTYIAKGHDRRLAKELANLLFEELTKRREDRNIIDDFRVF